jgi:hypothetical protein
LQQEAIQTKRIFWVGVMDFKELSQQAQKKAYNDMALKLKLETKTTWTIGEIISKLKELDFNEDGTVKK